MIVEADGFSFNFDGAVTAFIFDEENKEKPTYHGQPMKAVDIVVEFDKQYVFVEIKDPFWFDRHKTELTADNGQTTNKKTRQYFNKLRYHLKYKYRDSYLYRHAEDKVEKPIQYICLLAGFDNIVIDVMQQHLKRELPVGKKSERWKRAIVDCCTVVNEQKWNDNFPKWPVTRI